jgi:putative ABC transport system ATP-binding protein
MQNLAVTCESVIKKYIVGNQDFFALDKVNFEVRTGELMIIAGPSGSGKTTLISVIAGILDYEGGDCIVYGEHLNQMTEVEKLAFRAKNIGFVFQQFNLIPTLTVAENVAIPLIINGMERHEATEKATAILAKVGLENRANSSPRELSGGQQQRVAIARALVSEPTILMLDEPAGGLGSQDIEWMNSLIKNLSADMSVLLVEHHMDVVMSVCSKLYVLNFGEVIASGDAEKVRRDPAVMAAYLGTDSNHVA